MKLVKRGEFLKYLIDIKAETICEVGVKDGGFFDIVMQSPFIKKAYAIDVWNEYRKKSQNDIGRTQEELSRSEVSFRSKYNLDDRVEVLKGVSEDMVDFIPDGSLDFVYIDADHTYGAVKKDLEKFYPKMKKGGMMAGHDYLNTMFRGIEFGVKKAVDEFVDDYGLFLFTTDEPKFKSFFFFVA